MVDPNPLSDVDSVVSAFSQNAIRYIQLHPLLPSGMCIQSAGQNVCRLSVCELGLNRQSVSGGRPPLLLLRCTVIIGKCIQQLDAALHPKDTAFGLADSSFLG